MTVVPKLRKRILILSSICLWLLMFQPVLRGDTEKKTDSEQIRHVRVFVDVSGIDVLQVVENGAGQQLPEKAEGKKIVDILKSLGFVADESGLPESDPILRIKIKYEALGGWYRPKGGGRERYLYTGGQMSGNAKLMVSDRIAGNVDFADIVCGVKPEVSTLVDIAGRESPTGYEAPNSKPLWIFAEAYGVEKALTKDVLRLLLESAIISRERVVDYLVSGPHWIAREGAAELLEEANWSPHSTSERAKYLFAKGKYDDLVSLGSDAIPILIAGVVDMNWQTREKARNALRELADPRTHNALRERLELVKDDKIQREALKFLEDLAK